MIRIRYHCSNNPAKRQEHLTNGGIDWKTSKEEWKEITDRYWARDPIWTDQWCGRCTDDGDLEKKKTLLIRKTLMYKKIEQSQNKSYTSRAAILAANSTFLASEERRRNETLRIHYTWSEYRTNANASPTKKCWSMSDQNLGICPTRSLQLTVRYLNGWARCLTTQF